MPGDTLSLGQVARRGPIGVAFWTVAVFAGRRVWRHVKASAPPEPPGRRPFNWFGIAYVLVYLGVIGLMPYLMSR